MSSPGDTEEDGSSCQLSMGAKDSIQHDSPVHNTGEDVQTLVTEPAVPASALTFEYDAALVFASKDEELATKIEKSMNAIKLEDGTYIKVCLYDHPQFGGCIIKRPCRVLEKCRFVLIVLTKNTHSDDLIDFTKNEAIGKLLKLRNNRVISLHTQPKMANKQRPYEIPDGLAAAVEYTWYNDDHGDQLERCKNKIAELFLYHRQNPELTTSFQGGLKRSRAGAPLQRIFSWNGGGNGGLKSTEQQLPRSPELTRIEHESNMILKKFQKELFCPTFATKKAKEILIMKGCVFIVGRSGDGKTFLVNHILSELKEEKSSFQPYIITKPEDMDHVPPKNSVVFVDNIFGTNHFSSVLLEKWKVCFQRIDAFVHAGDMYFITTSTSHVRLECLSQIENIPLLSHIIDLKDEHCLHSYEKENMLTVFTERAGLQMSCVDKQKAVDSSLELGFPQCCKLFITNSAAQDLGAEFFQNPFLFLNEQISKLKLSESQSDKLAYMVLVDCIFKRGKFSSESLNPFSESEHTVAAVKEACGVQQNVTIDEIRKAVEMLCNMGYLKYSEQEGSYEFSHQSIYDTVCVSFGKDYVPKILELCPLTFLVANTTTDTISPSRSFATTHIIHIPSVHKPILFKRMEAELKDGNFKMFEHTFFTSKKCVSEFELFEETFRYILINLTLVLKLVMSHMMFFLTAANKYTPLVTCMMNIIMKMSKDTCQEHHEEEIWECVEENDHHLFSTFQTLTSILQCKNVSEIHMLLLHQCLEGACSAGNLVIFRKAMKLKNIRPCQDCFLKAVESSFDKPEIIQSFLSSESLGYVRKMSVVETLVNKKKVESLRKVFLSDKWKLSLHPLKKQKLLAVACSSGHIDMFLLLKETVGIPNCKDQLLFEAVTGKNRQIIEYLLEVENIHCVDQLGRSLLHHACLKMPDLCHFLMEKGSDHSLIDKNGMSALHVAIQHLDRKSVEKLIHCGLHVTMVGTQTQTRSSPLHLAALNDSGPPMVELLIQKGPQGVDMVNFQDLNGMTPLHIAAERPHGKSMIEELMKRNADPSTKDNEGKTALHRAAKMNLPFNIQTLLYYNAGVNATDKDGKTPLHYVLERRVSARDVQTQMHSVDYLISKHANVSLPDKDGNTCIHIAAKFNTPPNMFHKLFEKIGEHIGTNKDGKSPLHLSFHPSADLEIVKLLLSTYDSSRTQIEPNVLHEALVKQSPFSVVETVMKRVPYSCQTVKWDEIKLLKVLRHYQADGIVMFLQQFENCFPSSMVYNFMLLLCRKVTDDEQWKEGMDCLDVDDSFFSGNQCLTLLLTLLGSSVKMKYLFSKGVDVNMSDENGNTLLHIAVLKGSVEGTKALLEAGADVNKVNKNNETVLHTLLLSSSEPLIFQDEIFHAAKILTEMGIPENYVSRKFQSDWWETSIYDTDQLETHQTGAILHMLLNHKASLNVINNFGFSPLYYSLYDKTLLDQLVSAGADLTLKTDDGWTCLHSACMVSENVQTVNYILDTGMSPCVRDIHDIAPFHIAVLCGLNDIETLKRLANCSHDKTVCHSKTKRLFLHIAARYSVAEVVEMLIEFNSDMLFEEDMDGKLPIHYAVMGGDLQVLRLVTKVMVEVTDRKTSDGENSSREYRNIMSETAHYLSVGEKSNQRSADHNVTQVHSKEHIDQSTLSVYHTTPDKDQNTDLDMPTSEQQCFGIAGDFMRHKKKNLQQILKPLEDVHKETLLHLAARFSTSAAVDFLLKEGFEINTADDDGNTPLHIAAAFGRRGVVNCLVKAGADCGCRNKEKLTPFLYALSTKKLKVENIHELIENGVSVKTVTMKKESALHLLCGYRAFLLQRWREEMVITDPSDCLMLRVLTLLIEQGCDVNARNEDGQTPLHMAAASGNTAFIDILLDRGAEIDAIDNRGRTSLHQAVEGKLFLTAICLVERGANPYAVVRSGPMVLDILMNRINYRLMWSPIMQWLYQMLGLI